MDTAFDLRPELIRVAAAFALDRHVLRDAGWQPSDINRAMEEADVPSAISLETVDAIWPLMLLWAGRWSPIADAPRDGTEVDLWMNGQRWTGFRWTDRGWSREEGYPVVTRRLTGEPTHFMPAPGAPA